MTELHHIYLKRQLSCLGDQAYDILIDREAREVTIKTRDIDSALIETLVCRELPTEHDLVAYRDDNDKLDLGGMWLTKPAPFKLFIEFGGRVHRAEIVKLFDGGKVSVFLENPERERKRRIVAAAPAILRTLHERGLDAIAYLGTGENGADALEILVLLDAPTEDRVGGYTGLQRVIDGIDEVRTRRVHVEVVLAMMIRPEAADLRLGQPHLRWSAEQQRAVGSLE
jgi:hypothetical protein